MMSKLSSCFQFLDDVVKFPEWDDVVEVLESDDVVEVSMIEGPQYPFSVVQFALSQTFNIGIKPTTCFHVIGFEIYLVKLRIIFR